MNSKIVLAGSLMIVVAFFGGFFWLTRQRSQQLQEVIQSTTPQTQVFELKEADLTQEIRNAGQAETYSLAILMRGTIISVDSVTKTLSLLATNRNTKGQVEEQLMEVSLAQINEVTCWPEFMPTNGSEQIAIKDAYFPLEAGSTLYLQNQTTQNLNALANELTGKFAFVHLTNTSYPTGTNPVARTLAVLNCP